MGISIKRIYEPFATEDGYRILVDRLWPRGIKKTEAHIDQWLKDIAPSTALRKWFNHEPEKWEEFRRKYHAELSGSTALRDLNGLIHQHKQITLLYASREEKYNHAIVLKEFMTR